MSIQIKQGDAYAIPVQLTQNGEALAAGDIRQAEFYLGGYRKLYPGAVTFDPDSGTFYVPVSQAESFSWAAGSPVYLDVRIKFSGGDVQGIRRQIGLGVVDAVSQELL